MFYHQNYRSQEKSPQSSVLTGGQEEEKKVELHTSTIVSMTQKLIFKVEDMDCPNEVKAIKKELGPLLNGGEELLTFDLANGRLTVECQNGLPTEDDIIKSIGKAGMTAVLWNGSDLSIEVNEKKEGEEKTAHFTQQTMEMVEMKAVASHPSTTLFTTQKLIFKVEDMDCPKEVKAIKKELCPLLRGKEELLTFDLANGRLTVECQDGLPTEDDIIKSIGKAGMTAVLWNGSDLSIEVNEKKEGEEKIAHLPQQTMEMVEMKAVVSHPTTAISTAQRLIFKVEGMDCPNEVVPLKKELGPLLNGREELLTFDLINGKLTVECQDGLPTKEDIIKSIGKAGMTAILWNEHINQGQQGETFWQRYGHSIMTTASGFSLVAATIVHSTMDGVSEAFTSGEEANHAYPVASIVLYSTSIVTGGWFIFPKAISAIRRLLPDMNLLMTIAVAGAAATDQWFEAGTVSFLFAGSLLLETWNMKRAQRAVRALMETAPDTARIVDENNISIEKMVKEIPVGAMISVRPGEKIPMDSVLTVGSTYVNQAPITGESMPVKKEVGDELFAGTINGDSAILCKVKKVADDSTIARIIRLVEDAQSKRSPSEQWVEKFSRYYTPSMMLLSVLTAFLPPLIYNEPWNSKIYEGLVILVLACPCSLVISTPLSVVAGLSAAARSGVLIKGGMFLEAPAHINAIALDKTGTLTSGEPSVQEIIPLNNHSDEELLKRALSLEAHSDHPLARAIQRKAKFAGITSLPAERFQIFKGKGAEGYIGDKLYWIGSHRLLHDKVGETEPETLHKKAQEMEDKGYSIVAIGRDQHICGLFGIADAVRVECKEAIQELKKMGANVSMLTGDNKGTAHAIAKSIGIDEFFAELLPEDKVKQVKALMEKYQRVAMVGDGINDAPAMATSSLGIAMGAAGSDAAIETADIALMSDDLGKLPWLITHSRNTLSIIRQNIIFSLATKGLMIALTYAGKSSLWMAVAADVGVSLIVVSNGLRLLYGNDDSRNRKVSRLQELKKEERDFTGEEKAASTSRVMEVAMSESSSISNTSIVCSSSFFSSSALASRAVSECLSASSSDLTSSVLSECLSASSCAVQTASIA